MKIIIFEHLSRGTSFRCVLIYEKKSIERKTKNTQDIITKWNEDKLINI